MHVKQVSRLRQENTVIGYRLCLLSWPAGAVNQTDSISSRRKSAHCGFPLRSTQSGGCSGLPHKSINARKSRKNVARVETVPIKRSLYTELPDNLMINISFNLASPSNVRLETDQTNLFLTPTGRLGGWLLNQ